MAEAKPIFIVGLPVSTTIEQMDEISTKLSEKLTDYHVLAYIDVQEEAFSFKTFYSKDWQLSCTHGIKEMIAKQLGIEVPQKSKKDENS